MKQAESKTIIGITVGDPAGIGPEIVLKSLFSRNFPSGVCPVVFGDRPVLDQMMGILGRKMEIVEVGGLPPKRVPEKAILLVPTRELTRRVRFSRVSAECGRSARSSFSNAIELALHGWIDGIATAPIQKEALRLGGCRELDHTEILKACTGASEETTLFMTGRLRVFFLTRHIPLSEVPSSITRENVGRAIPRCIRFLKQLGIRNPKLAVAALNPHAGENGMFGREEAEILLPAVTQSRKAGCRAFGPIPADSVFHLANEGLYDGVLSLYHDQGHIAAKTLDFRRTVSLTMGLPFLRTSVDHGTAFDIAGRGVADETSMLEAIRAAGIYAKRVKSASGNRESGIGTRR
jgi:4-phospho-D-threonate 3-dehydrogenase / 4-phospho-D-erythronate 3-dehydrogenase